MLISLAATWIVFMSTGIRALLAEVPVVLEGPSTLELGLIGAGVFVIYAVTTRSLWRRREGISSAGWQNHSAIAAGKSPSKKDAAEQQPSRGAA